MVDINPPFIKQLKSRMKVSIILHMVTKNTFSHHTISNKKFLIIVGLAMKNFPLL
jgi:hypothetical protein